mgnify:FL=1
MSLFQFRYLSSILLAIVGYVSVIRLIVSGLDVTILIMAIGALFAAYVLHPTRPEDHKSRILDVVDWIVDFPFTAVYRTLHAVRRIFRFTIGMDDPD